ncbi:hypothetical protein SISNIDRAFT_452572 [Sistotremastrum niveocremeum HHB9708]|uniref:Capsular associated protein n=1 Tax=Sistotremastrum niveocremeum HHB9708 TaxID=1314777 RepID=A0A164WP16_9AGAM|nr:hypothetical protein SISNIDRAFT_452572 [Sistotremastrum niveocremeum HHB9708]
MFSLRRRNLTRLSFLGAVLVSIYLIFAPSRASRDEIKQHGVFERITRGIDKTLDPQRNSFLQSRVGRDESYDLLKGVINDGVTDYWERFQKPFITGYDTSHVDHQIVRTAMEDLLSLNGWVAADCPTLIRPFGQNNKENTYDDLARQNHLYFIAIVIHSADHFLLDQLAVIVQMARRLGPQNLFVSMLDYDSKDATATLLDLSEAVLTLLGVPFKIRHVTGATSDESAAYYPAEEAYTRNLVLQPLRELYERRKVQFHRVIWLKGFTCPNDIFETIRVSQANSAAMVCGMDWAEHNGFFIFSDRWRTRDMDGDQFRQSKSSSKPDAGPPRDKHGSERYAVHLPFQVFCCESGTHIVDPSQSYYRGIKYRAGENFHNLSTSDPTPEWAPDAPCMDSSQAWFCRDLWIDAAKVGTKESEKEAYQPQWEEPHDVQPVRRVRRDAEPAAEAEADNLGADGEKPAEEEAEPAEKGQPPPSDADANVGSDYDAMPDTDEGLDEIIPSSKFSIPNSAFSPARILVNPRCVTTYAGVSHTKLAQDLFGDRDDESAVGGKYVLDDWEGAPDSFVCQEQRHTGGRKATKTQRRLGFSVHDELERMGEIV